MFCFSPILPLNQCIIFIQHKHKHKLCILFMFCCCIRSLFFIQMLYRIRNKKKNNNKNHVAWTVQEPQNDTIICHNQNIWLIAFTHRSPSFVHSRSIASYIWLIRCAENSPNSFASIWTDQFNSFNSCMQFFCIWNILKWFYRSNFVIFEFQ